MMTPLGQAAQECWEYVMPCHGSRSVDELERYADDTLSFQYGGWAAEMHLCACVALAEAIFWTCSDASVARTRLRLEERLRPRNYCRFGCGCGSDEEPEMARSRLLKGARCHT